MKFLSIVERELRVAARRAGTYWLRTGVAMTVIAVSVCIILFMQEEAPNQIAQQLFGWITGGIMVYCLLVGAIATADCLSEEKREGTLGLLFLTDLKGYDVIVGKLVANSLNSFYGLLTIIPVLAVPLLMGGLTVSQVVFAALSLINAMFFSICAGMFASACCRSGWRAVFLTLGIVLLISVVIPIVRLWAAAGSPTPPPRGDMAFLCSPIFTLLAPYDLGRLWVKDTDVFWWSLAVVHAQSWIMLLLASLIVTHSWQDKAPGVRQMRWRDRWKLWSYGDSAERKRFRSRLLDVNAFFWLAARERLKPAWVWFTFGLIACIWAWGYSEYQREWFNEFVYVLTAFIVNALLKNWLAFEAVRQIGEDRRAGSLELLLATPMTVKEILRGQALALQRQFFWPVFLALSVEFAMMLAGMRESYNRDERSGWMAWWIAGMIVFVADLVALYWVGMWMGLASRNAKRAFSETIGRVLALPWVLFIAFMLALALGSIRGNSGGSWQAVLLVWMAIGLGVDFGFGLWARQKLLSEFREAAGRRFSRQTSFWKRMFGLAPESAAE